MNPVNIRNREYNRRVSPIVRIGGLSKYTHSPPTNIIYISIAIAEGNMMCFILLLLKRLYDAYTKKRIVTIVK